MSSFACGDFGPYCTNEPEQIMALHKWFAYGEMLMRVWAPVRTTLDRLWLTSGAEGYRPRSLLDQDLERFLYARTGLEAEMAHGSEVAPDPLAGALERLRAATGQQEVDAWNFIVGRGVEHGPAFIDAAIQARSADILGSDAPDAEEWARALVGADTKNDVSAYFRAQGAAKFIAVVR